MPKTLTKQQRKRYLVVEDDRTIATFLTLKEAQTYIMGPGQEEDDINPENCEIYLLLQECKAPIRTVEFVDVK